MKPTEPGYVLHVADVLDAIRKVTEEEPDSTYKNYMLSILKPIAEGLRRTGEMYVLLECERAALPKGNDLKMIVVVADKDGTVGNCLFDGRALDASETEDLVVYWQRYFGPCMATLREYVKLKRTKATLAPAHPEGV